MRLIEYLTKLQAKGYFCFTTEEALRVIGLDIKLIRASIRLLQKQGQLAEPFRGFHLIIPPQYRELGCLPAAFFIDELANYLNLPYYVCLLSASQAHGAAHQKPQVFQVMIPEKRRPIQCGRVVIQWITNKNMVSTFTQQVKTDFGYFTVSTPEATAKDLITYPRRCAGMNNVITVLSELVEKIRVKQLGQLARNSKKKSSWMQKLGYCFDFLGEDRLSNILYEHLEKRYVPRINLCTRGSIEDPILNKKWQLYINDNLEED